MKISKKLKKVDKLNKESEFVDKWGRQYKRMGLHFCFYRGGHWIPISWFSSDYSDKLWRIV